MAENLIQLHSPPDSIAFHPSHQSYFGSQWLKRAELYKEDDMQLQLPEELRCRCLLEVLEPLMVSVPILGSITSSTRLLMASKMVRAEIGAGYEFCQEGDEPDGFWLLESGQVLAIDLRGETCFTLEAPALLGDSVFVADQVPACRDRRWGYRAGSAGRIWRLSLRDLTAITRICPALQSNFYAYVQMKLLQLLADIPGDDMYCEMAARIMLVLEHAPGTLHEKTLVQLRKVTGYPR